MAGPTSADAFFAIGDRHVVCEDYARAGVVEGGRAHAIVADGCSGSPDTDVGARLLARSLERRLQAAPGDPCIRSAVADAADLAARAGLAARAVDATLLYVVAGAGTVQVALHGDGAVALRRRDGALELWSVCFARGAPAYPSYLLDAGRRSAYLAATGNARRTVTRHGPEGPRRVEREGLDGERFTFCAADYDVVAVMSDGVSSFQRGAERVPAVEVARALLAFKSSAGRFVTRRCRRFLGREVASRGWSHADDLAVAAIWLDGAA